MAVGRAMSSVAQALRQEELLERVRWQLRLRWVAIGLMLPALAVAWLLFPLVLPFDRLLAALAVLTLGNLIIQWLLLPRLERGVAPLPPDVLIKGQIGIDLAVYTVFLHWSGGAENPAAFYYTLQVIIAAVLLNRRWAYITAGAASALYALVLVTEYAGLLPHVHLAGIVDPDLYRRPVLLLLLWTVLTSILFLAAYLATSIVQRLRQREEELYSANTACELRSGELALANRRLNEMASARATFLRYVTHELRAPIAAVQSYLRLMREGYIAPDRVPEIAGRAERRSEEVLLLIGDLLDLGQVEHAQAQEGRERLDPREVLMDALDMLRPSAVEKQIVLDVDLADEVPVIFANPRHLSLLWNNLIGNAIKYTANGGRVRVALDSDGANLRVDVSDSGIGIAPEERERIFGEFYRSDTARRFAPHGTGIGLAIVKRVVDIYEGSIAVESEPGRGSTFRVRLPLRALHAGAPVPAPEWPEPPPHTGLPRTLV